MQTRRPKALKMSERLSACYRASLGSLMLIGGLSRRSVPGLALAASGAALLYRGATGHCTVYESLGLDTNHNTMNTARSIDRAPEATRQETSTNARRSSLKTEGDPPIKTMARRKGIGKAATA